MSQFDQPSEKRDRTLRRFRTDPDRAGAFAESIARFTGTPSFLIVLTVFVFAWMLWNTLAPERVRFDSAALGFTALTLMLSLQASYSAPLILLAQNRQDDRDRVAAENDRIQAERNLNDTEFLTREIASLQMSVNELATRDFVRSEIRDQIEEIRTELAGGLTKEEQGTRETMIDELRQVVARRDAEIEHLRAQIAALENTQRETDN